MGLAECPDCGVVLLALAGGWYADLRHAYNAVSVPENFHFAYGDKTAHNQDELLELINVILEDRARVGTHSS